MESTDQNPVPPYRVLDLTDEKGLFCGRILADLGADVVKIELPGGDPARHIGPFYHDDPDLEKSLLWMAYNANKRGVTLNIESAGGKAIFKTLVGQADAVIESFPPGYLAGLGLAYTDLSTLNPGLIMTSISPFGQDGPYRDFKASDLTLWCLGGMAYVSGDPDRPPVQVSCPQAYLHGAAAAAAATLIALYHREMTGEGQPIDVSIQEAVIPTLMNVPQFWDVSGTVLKRAGIFRTGLSTTANQRLVWRCKDGYVNFPMFGGMQGARTNRGLVRWMESENMSDGYLSDIKWEEFNMANATQEQFDRFEGPISRFFLNHTMAELYQGAIERDIMLYPVYSAKEVHDDIQLQARNFWSNIEHEELGETLVYPGSPFVLSGRRPGLRRAPLIGEHNEDIYCGELGFSGRKISSLRRAGAI
ncbi:MAG: CoA transferase [Chloroflexota bacterium]